jgi:methionine transaminase
MVIKSKLPNSGTSIFAVMSALANQHGAVNLGQGFPNFDPSERLQNLVSAHMKNGANQYAPMPGVLKLRERIAEKIELIHGAKIDPNTEITVTAGATQAIFCIINAVVHAGDEVILIEPAYDCYRPSVELAGGIPVIYELSAPDYAIDWEKMRSLISPKTRLILVNTPSNPAATTMQVADFQALTRLVEGTDILILSDEVYEHLVFDGQKHVSVWDFPELRKRSFSTSSFGKTYHSTGWKTGYVVASPNLTAEFRKVHQFNVFAVNHPVQAALAEFLENAEEWQVLPDFYQKKRDFFQNLIKKTRFRLLPCAGTYFQNVDYSAISNEPDMVFAERLVREIGVAAVPVSAFFSSKKDEKVLRFCFAKTENMLLDAGERLARV